LSFVRHVGIIIIVLTFVALAALYSAVTPLGEGPDEPGHASYVFFLARTLRLPDQRRSEVPGEGHQPPLAYALAAPFAAWLPVEQRQFDLPGNPRFTWSGGGELNAVAHGSREYWRWQGFVLAWHLARLVSVALGAATVALTYATAQVLVDRRRTLRRSLPLRLRSGLATEDESRASFILRPSSFIPLLAAALVAFNPQFLFVSALITNDALLTALSAAMLWLIVRGNRRWAIGDRQASIWHALVLGLVLGLALLTKQSALLLLPIAGLSVLEHSWRAWQNHQKQPVVSSCHPSAPRFPSVPALSSVEGSRGRASLVILSHIALFTLVTLLVCGWWYLRNRQLYGDLFGLAVFQREFATEAFDARSPAAWWGALAQLHASFWARFGWMNLPAPRWVIWLFGAIELFALGGWLWRLVGGGKKIEDGPWKMEDGAVSEVACRPPFSVLHLQIARAIWRWLEGGCWALLALPLLAFAWVVSFALTAGLVAWQGRLLFPALPAIAILLAIGLSNLAVGSRQSAVSSFVRGIYFDWLLVTGYCFLALWLPFGVIRPAYPFYTLSERVALERIGLQVYGRLGLVGDPGAELRGWLLAGAARPGNTLDIRLIWHALGRQNRNWTVFIHLVDSNEQIVAQDDAQPQAGAFPMKQWVAGDWIEDHHALALPTGVPPGSYALRVGLFDPHTRRRAAVFDQKGKLVGDYVDLGQIRIE
jgi:hypothetical protein